MGKVVYIDDWVCCLGGSGFQHETGGVSRRKRHFKKHSVGQAKRIDDDSVSVWLIGTNETWDVTIEDVQVVDVLNTGDKFSYKICNVCHCLLSVEKFAKNQNNLHGVVRRPTCI